MSALDDLDAAIAAEHRSLRACHNPDCRDTHLDQVLDYEAAKNTLTQPNPNPEDKRRALAILYTARTATGGTP